MTTTLPLADIRVIAVEQYGAGPFGSLILADLGAEVIKIEDPGSGGDIGRFVPPFQQDGESLFFETFNRNKRSLSIDLTTPAGREVLEDLVKVSDCVWSNLRGDVPARLGITYGQLKDVNPRIVCCSLSGFGMEGPLAKMPAYDYILQGMCGWMTLTGEPDGPPAKSGLSLVDYCGGLTGAISMIAGVHQARRDGRGSDCDLALYDVGITLLSYLATWYLTAGHVTDRVARSAHPSLVPFQILQTADGWVVVACAKEKFWQRLAVAIDRPELATDERFADFAGRGERRAVLLGILDDIFAARTSAEWLETLEAHGVPCGPVNSPATALDDPTVQERDLLVETEHPRFGTVRSVATPPRVGPRRAQHHRGPQRGEHAQHVLKDLLGYDDDRLAGLERQGAFGAA